MQLIAVCAALAALAAAHSPAPEPAPALKFDNIRLLVTNFDETFVFYRDVLGLTPTWGKPGENYASFAFLGGTQLALFKRQLMAEAVGAASKPATRAEQDTAALILTVDDVDAEYARLTAKGARFIAPPQNQDAWGIRAAHLRDPDGNLIEIFSPLKK
ncbi:MAG: VOC family protein [Vicinamibacterales bacterium]